MKLSLFTPEKTLLKEEKVQEILVPSVKGYLGILPGHAPLISLLRAGVLEYLPESENLWKKVGLGWGYLEVGLEEVKILAESAETKESLDKAKAEKKLSRVLKELTRWDLTPYEREKQEKEKLQLEAFLKL